MTRTPPYLRSILEEHFEELQTLWELRQAVWRHPDFHLRELAELDDRIEAHVDGLVLGGEYALSLLHEALGGDEPGLVFVAAFVLLRRREPASAEQVLAAFLVAKQGRLDGIRQALCYGPIEQVRERLKAAYETGPAAVAAAAAEVFAFHGLVRHEFSRWTEFVTHEDPDVRRAAWRMRAMVGNTGS